MRSNLNTIIGALSALALAACGAPHQDQVGTAQISINSRSASSVALSGITLTVRGPIVSSSQPASELEGLTAPQIVGSPFTLDAPPQSKTFDSLAVGWYYVDADSTGYQGHGWLQVKLLQMSTLNIVMQEKAGPPAWSDAAPSITSISVTPSNPYYGQTIHLAVVATDADASCGFYGCTTDPLSYEWASKCNGAPTTGVFAAANAMQTDFTSSCHGIETISIKVTDSKGIFSGAEVAVPYSPQGGTVNIGFNHYPTITKIAATDAQVLPGQTINLTLTADDVDENDRNALTATWSASCGSFDDATSFTPVWTAPTVNGDCTLYVNVYDGHGQYSYAHGSLVVHVGAVFTSQPFVVECNADYSSCPVVATSTGASAAWSGNSLVLTKTNPADAAGLSILGESQALTSLAFDVSGYCGAGSPRFNVFYEGTSVYSFFGCVYGTHNGSTVTFAPADATNSNGTTGLPAGAGLIKKVEIVMDEVGTATLSNIKVNGSVVGH